MVIDIEGEVDFTIGKVDNPDRIYFDLKNTKLASMLRGKSYDVKDGFLRQIRLGQYQPGQTRIVLDVSSVSDYSAFLLPNPARLIVDIRGGAASSKGPSPSGKTNAGATNAGNRRRNDGCSHKDSNDSEGERTC